MIIELKVRMTAPGKKLISIKFIKIKVIETPKRETSKES